MVKRRAGVVSDWVNVYVRESDRKCKCTVLATEL
jgi:hypothetical protein